jgi:hypothetical protein
MELSSRREELTVDIVYSSGSSNATPLIVERKISGSAHFGEAVNTYFGMQFWFCRAAIKEPQAS